MCLTDVISVGLFERNNYHSHISIQGSLFYLKNSSLTKPVTVVIKVVSLFISVSVSSAFRFCVSYRFPILLESIWTFDLKVRIVIKR